MMKFIFYLYLISCILSKFNSFGKNYRQRSSPCPDLYRETSPGYGELTVPSPEFGEMIVVKVKFVVFGSLVSNIPARSLADTVSMGSVSVMDWVSSPENISETKSSKSFKELKDRGSLDFSRPIKETSDLIRSGAATINYVLRFPHNPNLEQPPQITQIYYNDDLVCSSVAESTSGTRTTVTLTKSLKPGWPTVNPTSSDNNPKRPVSKPQQQPQHTQPPAIAPTLPSNVRDTDVCGTVDPRFRINPLVIGGDDIIHGTWPWLVAIFEKKAKSISYICGGNLVSNRVVVSAAHCFFKGRSTISATKVYVDVGRHNLDLREQEEEQRKQASLIKVHDDFMRSSSSSFDADIAVIVLKRVVEYTPYVRPICLWSGNNQLRKIEKKLGRVVGWGVPVLESKTHSNEPKTIDIPIVSQEVCLRDSDESFKYITSNRTFCAGSRNGAGPCNGDSGSGLALQQNGKWALRGIVSVSLATDPVDRKCNLKQFVVFTDVARFRSFIKEYVKLSI